MESDKHNNWSTPSNPETRGHNTRLKASNSVCLACGKEYPHKGISPANGKKCNVCNRWNHFAKYSTNIR